MGEENSTASISRTTFLFFSPLFSFDDVDDLQEELFSCSENCDLVTSGKTVLTLTLGYTYSTVEIL